MPTPKVSVVLPCYNGEDYLNRCIDSILNQTLRELEVICIDDGSSDRTLEILRTYEKQDPRVRVLSQENAGAGAARNLGLRQAKGEYLSFLDADDFFEPDMLRKAVETADGFQADYVVFGSDRYHMDTDSFEEVPWTILREDLPPYMPFSYRQLTGNVFLSFVGWAWDKVYRRSFVESRNLLFQEQRTTNDMLFVFSALVTARRIAVVDQVLAHQRRGSGDSLSVTREKSWHCFYDALTALKERLVQENVYWELEKDYINYALHFCLWHLNSLEEPSHSKLRQKLVEEWFEALGILGKPEHYFWSREEYAQYKKLCKDPGKATGENMSLPEDAEKTLPERYRLRCGLRDGGYDTANLFEMNVIFDRIRDELMESPDWWQKYQFGYWRDKLECYQNVLAVLEPEHRETFQTRMRREFRRGDRLDQLNRAVFTEDQWRTVRDLVRYADGAVSVLQSVGIVRKLSGFVPAPIKRFIISVLQYISKKSSKGKG